jgi:hypothetical protein
MGALFFEGFAGHGDEADVDDLPDGGLAIFFGNERQGLGGPGIAQGEDQAPTLGQLFEEPGSGSG